MGALWGGAVGGLAEIALIAATASTIPEFGFVPYAVIGYALLGAVIGTGVAAAQVAPNFVRCYFPSPFGLGASIPLAALVLVIGRYHINQRVFHEELTFWSINGALAYLGLVALAALAAAAALLAGRWLGERKAVTLGALGALLLLVLASLGIGRLRVGSDTVRSSPPVATAPSTRPNVILIIADTLRADALSTYGASGDRTPNMDALAADGVRFAQAFSQSSWTRPSIATILTSLHPRSHGATHKTSFLRDAVVTAAEAFRAAGYWTAAFVSNINIAPVFNFHQGFTEYTYLSPNFYFWAGDTAARLTLYKLLRLLRERFFADRIYAEHFYQDATLVTERTLRWLENVPRRPFFLLIHYMDAHDPYLEIPYTGYGVARVSSPHPAPERREELHHLYLEDVEFLDQQLGRIVAGLRRLGLYENSVILLTGDHGEEFQEHGGWWHGTTLYQEQLHVPLIVKRPAGIAAGQVIARPVATVDIAATLLSSAGISPPPTYEGADLFGGAQRRVLLADEDFEGNVLASIRSGPWKLITANPNNPRGLDVVELYNLDKDPEEKENLAAAEPDRVSAMLALLSRARAELGRRGGLEM